MGGLRMTRNDLATYELMSRAGNDIKSGMLQYGLSRAADVKPETVSSTDLTETTPGTDGMVYDEDTGQYLPKYMDGGQPTEQAQAQLNTPADGASEAPQGMRPTFSEKTTTRHKMGDQEQDAPFSPEQVDAQRFRNQADVYTRFGMADKAAAVHGLAKGREEEGIANQIRTAGTVGMKGTKDMRDEEKMFAMSKNMYEAAIKMNRPDLATGYYNQMNQNRDALMSRANDRAERVYRSTGNISGYVDTYNRYVADGNTIDEFKRNDDGSHTFKVNDGTGKARDITVPKERISEYLLALRDPKRISELEAKRAEILFKAQADSQEAMNKPVAVGKDQTLVIPGTGQTFAPGANRGFDVKEAGPVLDDLRNHAVQVAGKFDDTTGKWTWTPAAMALAGKMERLYMKNPGLPPTVLRDIASSGVDGKATIEIGGTRVTVPAIHHNGRAYLLGGADAGKVLSADDEPTKPMTPFQALTNKQPVAQREVSGKISGGMQKAGPKTPTPADFPRVSADQQAVRDGERRAILQRELETYPKDGSPERRALEDEARRAGILVPA